MKSTTMFKRHFQPLIAAVLLACFTASLHAAELQVISFVKDPLNIKPQTAGFKDNDAKLCALIRIESDVAGRIDIIDPTPFKSIQIAEGVGEFYVSRIDRNFTIKASGYLPKFYKTEFDLEEGAAYIMQVKSVGDDVKRLERSAEIKLIYTPQANEEVLGGIDGGIQSLDFSRGELTLKPSSGTHTVRLNSKGRVWEKRYELTFGQKVEETVVFSDSKREDWTVGLPGGLFIESDPPGATVLLNQVEKGVTPLELKKVLPGKYTIEVSKDLYLPDSKILEVKTLEIPNAQFKLVPNFGRVLITSTPTGSDVFIKDQLRGQTPLDIPRLNAGIYSLKIAQSLYYDESDNFEIKPGGEFVKEYKLKPKFGTVSVKTDPPGAEVTVLGVSWGKTPLVREKVPSGQYLLRISSQYYFEEELNIEVFDGLTTERNIPLRSNVGRLSVTSDPTGADVTITETKQKLGQTPLIDLPLDRGSYTIHVEKDLYEPYERAAALTYGGKQSIEATLQRSAGHLQVSSTPARAKIYINGKSEGETPKVVRDLPTGSYEVRLEKDGYDIQIGKVEILRNQVVEFSQNLGTRGTEEWLKRRSKARLIALVAPSGGQFSSKQNVRGTLYAGAFAGALAMAYTASSDHDKAKTDYEAAESRYRTSTNQAVIDAAYASSQSANKKMKEASDKYLLSLAAAVGVYGLQLTDAWFWGGGDKPVSTQLGLAPGEVRLSLSIPLGGVK
jgi:hypothetical protein